jgi:hypothetical protein
MEKYSNKIIPWLEENQIDYLWLSNDLLVVAPEADKLADISIDIISAKDLYDLANEFISLLDCEDFTPTRQDHSIPIKVDKLLKDYLNRPPAFAKPIIRNWIEWFGLHPKPKIKGAWSNFCGEKNLVKPLANNLAGEVISSGLGAFDGKNIYFPISILISLKLKRKPMNVDTLVLELNRLRHKLLRDWPLAHVRAYYDTITRFLRNPRPSLESHEYREQRAKGQLVDITLMDWDDGISQPMIDAFLVELENLYNNSKRIYSDVINRVQGEVWEAVGNTYDNLLLISKHSGSELLLIDPNNYHESCQQISRRLKSIADAYTLLTNLELRIGVDRHLSGQAFSEDMDIIDSLVRRVGYQNHIALNKAREIFLRKWNLSKIAPILLHLLGLDSQNTDLTYYFPNNQKRVIFILLDALGYTQFHWFLDSVRKRSVAPLTSNIFNWLYQEKQVREEYILASNLVSITGACLPTIFTGALPKRSGVIGSHMVMEGHHLNVLKGFDEHYELNRKEIENIYRRNINWEIKPFAQAADEAGVDVRVFHGGKMGFRPLSEYTYGSLIKKKKVKRVDKAEGIFAEALTYITEWVREPDEKKLSLIYYPLIDSSGHRCGPYTQFQIAELNQLNFVFTHFLVDLAYQLEEIFDGYTSVVITADHGMFESSKNIVNHRTIRKILGGKSATKNITFVYDNRAMLLYGVSQNELPSIRRKLLDFFESNGLPISVLTKEDDLVKELLYDPSAPWSSNCPDLILQFYDAGVFYYDDKLPVHMYLYGAHGGTSSEETFVPFIHFTLTDELARKLRQFM